MRDTFTRQWKRTIANFSLSLFIDRLRERIAYRIIRCLQLDTVISQFASAEIEALIPLTQIGELTGQTSKLISDLDALKRAVQHQSSKNQQEIVDIAGRLRKVLLDDTSNLTSKIVELEARLQRLEADESLSF